MTEVNDSIAQGKPKLTALDQVRLKNAAEAHRVHKSIFIDPVTGEPQEGFQPWPQFRDEFLADWKANRRVVTESEADMHFDRIADESLTELDTEGVPADVNQVVDQVEQAEAEVESAETETPVVAEATEVTVTVTPKRRGRPPKVASTSTKPAKPARAAAKKASKPARKAAAKKKGSGKSTSERAQHVIEVYQAKGWSRKDILEKLQSQIEGLGAAYASTLYQKFAK